MLSAKRNKIVFVLPGAGDSFYCQNCIRDIGSIRALIKKSCNVLLIPMYLPPPFLQERPGKSETPVFFGAVNAFLSHKHAFFRSLPSWIRGILDSKAVLAMVAKFASSTRAASLGEMTESMLLGEDGVYAMELVKLVAWLRKDGPPDIVHISSPLLLGVGVALKKEFGAGLVCSLQDEDQWIDSMNPGSKDRIYSLMAEKAKDVDAFVSVSDWFAEIMQDKLMIPRNNIFTVYPSVDIRLYRRSGLPMDPPVIGYLSRISESSGFGILAEAFRILKGRGSKFRDVKLLVSGGQTADDMKSFGKIKRAISDAGFLEDVIFQRDFSESGRRDFLSRLTVLSVPSKTREAFGLFMIEAMAAGVPCVQPDEGGFSEVIGKSGAGILYSPNTPQILAEKLDMILSEKEMLKKLSDNGIHAAENLFSPENNADNLVKIYEKIK